MNAGRRKRNFCLRDLGLDGFMDKYFVYSNIINFCNISNTLVIFFTPIQQKKFVDK